MERGDGYRWVGCELDVGIWVDRLDARSDQVWRWILGGTRRSSDAGKGFVNGAFFGFWVGGTEWKIFEIEVAMDVDVEIILAV